MSGLHANTGAMNSDGNNTIQCAEDFANELANLKNNIEGLMSIWRGPAATSFNNSYTEQANNLDQFQALLNELGEKIVSASNTLNQTEEEAASAAGQLF